MSSTVWQTHEWFTAEPVTATPVLNLDYAAGHIAPGFEPTEDDQGTRNDVTAQRPGGSSARIVATTGPLSTAPPPDGAGRYDESVDVNVETDEQIADQASWRVHLGTVDEPRYPSITLHLHRHLDLVTAVAAMDSGDLLTVANTPDWLPPGDIEAMLQGYRERLTPFEWEWTANTGPASPWTVAVQDDAILGRLDTGGSELAADLPVDELVLNANTGFEVDTAGWLTSNLGTGTFVRSTAQAHSGVASGLLTPDGVTGFPTVFQGPSIDGPATKGTYYRAAPWVYSPNGYPDVRVRIDWRDATDTIFANSGAVGFTVPAGVWTQIDVTAAAPAGAVAGGVRVILGGTPAATDTLHVDDAELTPSTTTFDVTVTGVARWIDSAGFAAQFPFDVTVGGEVMTVTAISGTVSPQKLTVTRSVNGVVKAHSAGAALSLAQPAVLAL